MANRASSLGRNPTPAKQDRSPVVDLAHTSEQSIGYLVRYAFRSFDRTLTLDMAKRGILAGQWGVLRVLWKEEGLSQVEVAERLKVERASLTSLLAGMEKAGFITRTPDTQDRRKMRIHLTPKGRQSRRQLFPVGEAVNAKATKDFTDAERQTLRQLLNRLVANLEE